MKRIAALLLAVLFLMTCCLTACRKHGKNDKDAQNNTEPPATESVEQPTPELPTPTPEPEVDPGTKTDAIENEELRAIANEILLSVLTSNAYTYHQFVVNKDSFDIAEEDIPTGWGDYTYQTHIDGIAENNELLGRMNQIGRASLCEYDAIVYDNIMEAIRLSNDLADYYYYDEPLSPFNGEHTMLPLIMTMYEIRNAEDAESYLLLLEDMPRYIGQLEQFEVEKAGEGLFMTENALDQVINSCNTYAEEGENCFLISCFSEALDKVDSISAEDKATLIERNNSCVLNQILPAYSHLAQTLEAHRGDCRPFEGAAARSENEKRYFELKIRSEAAVDMSCDKMADLMKDLAGDCYNKLFEIIMSDYSSLTNYGSDKTSGDPNKDIEYLLELIRDIYPEIPEQNIEFVTIPDAVSEDFSPAAYLISAFDDPSRNIVMFNPSADNRTMLFTLAHECFPGHLYQTQYFRANKNLSLAQQALAPSGYSEGWAVFSEFIISAHAVKYNINTCLIEKYEGIMTNILIPGYVSVKVNYDGWTKEDIKNYLQEYSLSNDDYVDIIYEYAVNVPLYFFNYAMGFTNTMRIYNAFAPKNDSQLKDFLAQYLSYGPCYYDILNEKFGISD